jgi:hypothetical protein
MSQHLDDQIIRPEVTGDFSSVQGAYEAVRRYQEELEERKTYQAALNLQESKRRWKALRNLVAIQ